MGVLWHLWHVLCMQNAWPAPAWVFTLPQCVLACDCSTKCSAALGPHLLGLCCACRLLGPHLPGSFLLSHLQQCELRCEAAPDLPANGYAGQPLIAACVMWVCVVGWLRAARLALCATTTW